MTYCPSCGGGTVELPEGRKASKINSNGWIYFGVNTVFLLFALLRKLQGIEFIFFFLGILLLWALLVREKNRIYSISEKLTAILFIDALLVFLSGMDIWRMNMCAWWARAQRSVWCRLWARRTTRWLPTLRRRARSLRAMRGAVL